MNDTDRVQRWRQRMRDEGKELMHLWLTHDTKRRLEDLARTWHCAPSELVEQALAGFHPGNPHVPVTVAATEQLLSDTIVQSPAITAYVTETVRATLAQELPALVRAAVDAMHVETVPLYVTDMGNSLVTETAPETVPPRKGGRPRSALGQRILDVLADHPKGLTAEEIRVHAKAERPVGDILAGMRRLGDVTTHGEGGQRRYVRA